MLTIDRAYFELTGGLERWLYRLVRKHGGRQDGGWSFDFKHLHAKSGSLSPLKHFAFDLRDIVRRQPFPAIGSPSTAARSAPSVSIFTPVPVDPLERAALRRRASQPPGDKL